MQVRETESIDHPTTLNDRVGTAIIMPDDIALEKVNALKCLGASVERVRPASIVNDKHVRPLCWHPPLRLLENVMCLTLISVCGTSPVSRP